MKGSKNRSSFVTYSYFKDSQESAHETVHLQQSVKLSKSDAKLLTKYVKGVPFDHRRYTN